MPNAIGTNIDKSICENRGCVRVRKVQKDEGVANDGLRPD